MKNILSVFAGVIMAIITLTLVEMFSASLNPMPAGLDTQNKLAMKAYLENLPAQSALFLLLGYALSAFVGGLTAAAISKKTRQAVTVGIILTVANCMNFDIPHPLWLIVVTIVIFVPFAYIGGKIVTKTPKQEI